MNSQNTKTNEDRDPFSHEVMVRGLGAYTVGTLQKNIESKIRDLHARAKSGDPSAFRQIAYLLKDPAFNAMLDALITTYDKLATQTQHRKAFGEDIHGAKKGSQVKGREKTPSKSKPTHGGETAHPLRGRLVGEADVKEMWEHYQHTNKIIGVRSRKNTGV